MSGQSAEFKKVDKVAIQMHKALRKVQQDMDICGKVGGLCMRRVNTAVDAGVKIGLGE